MPVYYRTQLSLKSSSEAGGSDFVTLDEVAASAGKGRERAAILMECCDAFGTQSTTISLSLNWKDKDLTDGELLG